MSRKNLRLGGSLLAAMFGAAAAFSGALGCQSIADIPEVTYSATCDAYCDSMLNECIGPDSQYENRRTCMEVCTLLDKNANYSTATEGNTIRCRQKALEQASESGDALTDRTMLCAQAGPGGGSGCTAVPTSPNCEGYCALYVLGCGGDSKNPFASPDLGDDLAGDQTSCIRKCSAVAPMDTNYAFQAGQMSGDTLGCRLYYASAAVVNPDEYCDRAGIRPAGACLGKGVEPSCDSFCLALDTACQDDLAVYESIPQCKAVCEATKAGTKQSTTPDNTIGCRTAHAFNALLIDDEAHCPHIGPLGANVCGEGGNCEAYCSLASTACPSEFEEKYLDETDCEEQCATIEGFDKGSYSVKESRTGNTVQCRGLAVSRALAKPTAERAAACAAVFGGSPCTD
jgi:hypothetical protein